MNISTQLILSYLQDNDNTEYNNLLKLKKTKPSKYHEKIQMLKQNDDFNLKIIEDLNCTTLDGPKEQLKQLMNIMQWKKGIVYTDQYTNIQNTIEAIREHYEATKEILFPISQQYTLILKITSAVDKFPKKITLIQEYTKKIINKNTQMPQLLQEVALFNEKLPKDAKLTSKRLAIHAYTYRSATKTNEYIIMTEKPLEPGQEYIIDGLLIELADAIEIGSQTLLKYDLPIILVNSFHPRIISLKSKKQLLKLVSDRNITHDRWMNYLFSRPKINKSFRHLPKFEELVSAFLLAAPYGDEVYPLHLMIIAEPGTGKSFLLDSIHSKFDEYAEVVEGSGSTIKSLIPSFKSNIPELGALVTSRRICCVDELFRILTRVEKEERNTQLAMLNPLLEHKRRTFGSGNCTIHDLVMTSKVLWVTNPTWGTKDIGVLCKRIDESFLSRNLIYYQDKFEVEFVKSRMGIQEYIDWFDADSFISVYDFLQSFRCVYDVNKLREIFSEYEVIIPGSALENLYKARYFHHMECLIDGIIKTRCLCELDLLFEASEQDYLTLKSIWRSVICGWLENKGSDIEGVQANLTSSEQYILEFMREAKGRRVRYDEIQKIDIPNALFYFNKLAETGFLIREGNYFYLQDKVKLLYAKKDIDGVARSVEEVILSVIKDNEDCTVQDILRKTEIPLNVIEDAINNLLKKGDIFEIHGGKFKMS